MARRRFETRSKPVNRHWTTIVNTTAALAAGTQGTAVVAAQHQRETLLRVRGTQTSWIDAAQAGGQGVLVSLGLILVPEGTGSTVLWSPLTDGDAPWLYWESFALGYEEYVTDVIDAAGLPVYRSVIDNKAMRIIRPDVEVQWVVENTTGISAASINVMMHARVLTQQ